MIHSKNESGFTLIEVLLAGALVGIVLGPIYFLQGTVFDRVLHMAQRVERLFVAYDFFIDVRMEDEDSVSETIDKPLTEVSFERAEPHTSSVLAKQFNNISIETIKWSWSVQRNSYEDSFISLVFEPPEEQIAQPEDKAQGKAVDDKKPKESPKAPAAPQAPVPSGGKK